MSTGDETPPTPPLQAPATWNYAALHDVEACGVDSMRLDSGELVDVSDKHDDDRAKAHGNQEATEVGLENVEFCADMQAPSSWNYAALGVPDPDDGRTLA